MAMKKRSVDEELKMLQAEAARDLSVSRARVQSEWRWISSPEGKDAIWESVRRDVLPQGSLAQWIFRVFSQDKGSRSRHTAGHGLVSANIFSSSLLGKMLPASWAKYTPLAIELFELARPMLVTTALALGRSVLRKSLVRLNPFRRKKKSK